jgi:hypothetical protein
MPQDNPVNVDPGRYLQFPQDGPVSGSFVTRLSASSFELNTIGKYLVYFQVSVVEAGQLVLELNGVPVPRTVVGRSGRTSQIVGSFMLDITIANSILKIQTPIENTTSLTIAPYAGGELPVSANLVITLLSETV